MKEKIYYSKMFKIISLLFVCVIYFLIGTNVWAEVVLEFIPYANGTGTGASFGNYLTLFPIFSADSYNYLELSNFITWPTFASILTCIYSLICVYSIIDICERRNIKKFYTILFLIVIYIFLVFPSISSIINITHFGYIPIIVSILFSVFEDDYDNIVGDIPWFAFIPLGLSIISKPSLTFVPFLLVIVTTKLYKNKLSFIFILISTIFTAYQTLLFTNGNSNLVLNSIYGIFNIIFSFVQSIGASLLFLTTYYRTIWTNETVLIYSVICFCLGCIIIFAVLRKIFNFKNKIQSIKKLLTILLLLGVVLFPHLNINFELSFEEVVKQNLNLCFFRPWMQYQFLSSITIFALIIAFLNKETIKKRNFIILMVFLTTFLTNGLVTALYSSKWNFTNTIKTDKISYNYNDAYAFAPYSEWNWVYSDNIEYWVYGGNSLLKYKTKPLNNGNIYRNKNNDFMSVLPIKYKNIHLYLTISDPSISFTSDTSWIDIFKVKNKPEKYSIIFSDNNKFEIEFGKANSYSTRYAIIDYEETLVKKLYNEDYLIVLSDGSTISSEHINILITWNL